MDNLQNRLHVRQRVSCLLQQAAQDDDFVETLARSEDELLSLTGASGAVLFFQERAHLIATTPTQGEIRELVQWLRENDPRREQLLWQTADLSIEYSKARDWSAHLPGLLAISLSQVHRSYVLWFRREEPRTPAQSSDPPEPTAPQSLSRNQLAPHEKRSGEKRSGEEPLQAGGRAAMWQAHEIEAANELRNAICVLLLKRAEEVAQQAQELAASNRELELFAHSVSHDLRAPLRHISGFAALLHKRIAANLDETSLHYLNTIGEAARKGGVLVDDLLGFSRMTRSEMSREAVDMNALASEARNGLAVELQGRDIRWKIAELPIVRGDAAMLSVVLRNLLGNAVKYTLRRPDAHIEIGCLERNEAPPASAKAEEVVFFVRDNGAGFDMRNVDKIFGVFQRLHGEDEFEGTGIGLANVQRIIARHGGRVWAEGEINRGATIFFSLPRRSPLPEDQENTESSTR